MKFSYLFLILLVGLGFYTFYAIEKADESIIRTKNDNYGSYNNYNKYQYYQRQENGNTLVNSISEKKAKQIKNAPKINGAIIGLILVILFFVVLHYEDKNDPIKNLEELKENNLITQSEFEDKVKIAKNKKIENIEMKKQEKLINELKNLREKGILTETEFEEKLSKVKLIKNDKRVDA